MINQPCMTCTSPPWLQRWPPGHSWWPGECHSCSAEGGHCHSWTSWGARWVETLKVWAATDHGGEPTSSNCMHHLGARWWTPVVKQIFTTKLKIAEVDGVGHVLQFWCRKLRPAILTTVMLSSESKQKHKCYPMLWALFSLLLVGVTTKSSRGKQHHQQLGLMICSLLEANVCYTWRHFRGP